MCLCDRVIQSEKEPLLISLSWCSLQSLESEKLLQYNYHILHFVSIVKVHLRFPLTSFKQ